jgi:lipopolysaccharide biosynthesis regulator YciM
MGEKAIIDEKKQNQEIQTYCPLTGVRVLEYGSKQFTISGMSVTWWHCPTCNGWHILTTRLSQAKDSAIKDPAFQASIL